MRLLDLLWKRWETAYRNVLLTLVLLNIGLDLTAIILGEYFILTIPQNLRIHFWLLYAMLGCWIARKPEWTAAVRCRFKPWMLVLSLILMVAWLRVIGSAHFGYTSIEAFYGSLPVQLAALMVFISALGVNFSKRREPHIAFLSSLTMGIYIMHPFILAVFNKFVPAFTQGGSVMNLLFWLLTTIACAIATMLVQKIPVLNRLLKL